MTPIAKLSFSAFIIIGLEFILMAYIFMLQPKSRSNRLFALYMLMLSISSYCILVASITGDIATVYNASRTQALATMMAGPLLWLVILHVFIPQFRLTYWVTSPLLVLAILPLIVGGIDWLTSSQLFFEFRPEIYAWLCSTSKVLNGRLGNIFYIFLYFFTKHPLGSSNMHFCFFQVMPDRSAPGCSRLADSLIDC